MFTAFGLGALIVAGTLAYVAWAAIAIAQGANPLWFVLGLPLAWYAMPFLFAALWFALARRFGASAPQDVRLSLRQRARMFWREMLALSRSGHRMALYRWLMRDPPPSRAQLPVLLVHGVMCNAGIWY